MRKKNNRKVKIDVHQEYIVKEEFMEEYTEQIKYGSYY